MRATPKRIKAPSTMKIEKEDVAIARRFGVGLTL
jgi:hypothetical protein